MKKRIRKLTPEENSFYNNESQLLFRGEVAGIKHLITEVVPTGIVSVVSDTYDYWRLVTVGLPILKDIIMNRDGKYVTRPDSGDPVLVMCGDERYSVGSPEYRGTIECLWDIFGGTMSVNNCRQLHHTVGAIYGDSISLERATEINERLWRKGFASTNWVAGVGSFYFQMVTRDTFGSAVKATFCKVGKKPLPLFKDPKTDDGTKRSARGYLRVNADYTLSEEVSPSEEDEGLLEVVFENSELKKRQSLSEIRARLMAQV